MRVLMKVNMSTDEANALVRAGKLEETIQSILTDQKPEAAYFIADFGMRTGLIVVDMKDSSEIPSFAEPWFLALGASIELTPVMTPEDLSKGSAAFLAAVKKYG